MRAHAEVGLEQVGLALGVGHPAAVEVHAARPRGRARARRRSPRRRWSGCAPGRAPGRPVPRNTRCTGRPSARRRSTARIGVSASSQRQTPPAHSSTRSSAPMPGQTPLSTGSARRGGSVGQAERDHVDERAEGGVGAVALDGRSARPAPIPPSHRSRCFSLAQITRSATAHCAEHRAPGPPRRALAAVARRPRAPRSSAGCRGRRRSGPAAARRSAAAAAGAAGPPPRRGRGRRSSSVLEVGQRRLEQLDRRVAGVAGRRAPPPSPRSARPAPGPAPARGSPGRPSPAPTGSAETTGRASLRRRAAAQAEEVARRHAPARGRASGTAGAAAGAARARRGGGRAGRPARTTELPKTPSSRAPQRGLGEELAVVDVQHVAELDRHPAEVLRCSSACVTSTLRARHPPRLAQQPRPGPRGARAPRAGTRCRRRRRPAAACSPS